MCKENTKRTEARFPPSFVDISWLFFDVGSTLVDETEAYAARLREMVQNTSHSYASADALRRRLDACGMDGHNEIIRRLGLTKARWPVEKEQLAPHAIPVLQTLCARGYTLGILANQTAGLSARLEAWGIRDCFSILLSSADVGIAKPDPALFRLALAQATCRPENAVMIGDRPDNDLRPARAVGMKTVWYRSGSAHGLTPEAASADAVIDSLTDLLTLFPALTAPATHQP